MSVETVEIHSRDHDAFLKEVHSFEFWFQSVEGYLVKHPYGVDPHSPIPELGESEKEALIAAQPKKFFTTSHYDGEPIVLVRLAKVTRAEAVDLIAESWRNRATKTAVKDRDAAQGGCRADDPRL